jgi:septum site-determining protein MinD
LNQARIVSVSSAYGGTGKTSLTVNIAAVAAQSGLRVSVVDTAMQSPGLADALSIAADYSLADYLCGDCDIGDTVLHIPPLGEEGEGALFCVAAIRGPEDAACALIGGYDPGLLVEGCRHLISMLDLDLLMLDTPSGLTTEAIVCVGIADTKLHVDRFRGRPPFGLTPSLLVVNMVPASLTELEVLDQAASVHGEVPTVALPYAPEFASIGAGGVFVSLYPDHEVSRRIQAIARMLTGRPLAEFAPSTYLF